jgi:hypothetical protein
MKKLIVAVAMMAVWLAPMCLVAEAHGVVVPLGVVHSALRLFTNHGSSLAPLALSLSRQNTLITIKTLVNTGITNGAIVGTSSLSSGQFLATQYLGSSTTLINFGPTLRAFGTNPLNAVPRGQTVTINNLSTEFIPSAKGVTSVKGIILPATESGATRQVDNFYREVTAQSTNAGEQFGTHPIGGILYGQSYTHNATDFLFSSRIALSFGNNPFNSPNVTSIPYLQNGSYFQVTDKLRLNVSSGQFFATEYIPHGGNQYRSNGTFLYVFGSNPLNSLTHGPFPFTSSLPAFFTLVK